MVSNKILSITEQVPKPTTLPYGKYQGIYGGYNIEVKYEGKIYNMRTEEGVRGIGFKVVVTIDENGATFESLNN